MRIGTPVSVQFERARRERGICRGSGDTSKVVHRYVNSGFRFEALTFPVSSGTRLRVSRLPTSPTRSAATSPAPNSASNLNCQCNRSCAVPRRRAFGFWEDVSFSARFRGHFGLTFDTILAVSASIWGPQKTLRVASIWCASCSQRRRRSNAIDRNLGGAWVRERHRVWRIWGHLYADSDLRIQILMFPISDEAEIDVSRLTTSLRRLCRRFRLPSPTPLQILVLQALSPRSRP
jgi:hypothetical protein